MYICNLNIVGKYEYVELRKVVVRCRPAAPPFLTK